MRGFLLALLFLPLYFAQQNRGYYRLPAIHGNVIAFTSEGDLWESNIDGGIARRLGHGVDPDIVVDNLPNATFNGKDAQLEAALKHLEDLIRKEPIPLPAVPSYPDKTFHPRTSTK